MPRENLARQRLRVVNGLLNRKLWSANLFSIVTALNLVELSRRFSHGVRNGCILYGEESFHGVVRFANNLAQT